MEKINVNHKKILQEFSLYLQAVGYRPRSKRAIERGVEEFLNWLEQERNQDFSEVNRQIIKSYESYLKQRPNKVFTGGLSSRSINYYLTSLRLLLGYQEHQGLLDNNPMSSYDLPAIKCQKREILTAAEIGLLYAVCETFKERCILHIYYGLGLRRSEGVALNLQDIDLKNKWLHVVKGKGGKGRTIPLTDSIQADFKTYILEERPIVKNSFLMLYTAERRMSGYCALAIVKTLLKRAKIQREIGLHSLRHSIATHLVQNGMHIEQVQNYLGHSHLETTQKYVHDDPKRVFKSNL